MALKLNPALIAHAVPYTANLQRMTLNTCNPKPQQGMAGVQIQVTYATAPGMKVDMAAGNGPNPPLAQCCGIWIDNSASTHDINIIIPDSGQVIRCAFGAQKMAPILSSLANPLFYVMLDDNGSTNATDITTLIVTNMYVPEYTSEDFNNSLSYGYSGVNGVIELQPSFSQSQSFPFSFFVEGPVNNTNPILKSSQFYLTAVDISVSAATSIGAGTIENYFLQINEISTAKIILQEAFTVTPVNNTTKLISLSGLQYISPSAPGSDTGLNFSVVQASVTGGSDLYIIGTISGNFFGGILAS